MIISPKVSETCGYLLAGFCIGRMHHMLRPKAKVIECVLLYYGAGLFVLLTVYFVQPLLNK